MDDTSLPPPLASVVPSTILSHADLDSSSSSSARSSSRRIQPIPLQVNAVDKRRHFPSKLHAYFVTDDYAPGMSQFEKDFLNDCIIYHCCQDDKMIQLPPITEVALQGIKDFQSNNLIQQLTNTQIAPSLMLEGVYVHVHGKYLCYSTLNNS